MRPQFPLYVVTKGRAESRVTIRLLERMGVDFFAVIERQEYDAYAEHLDAARLLVLDPSFQRDYEALDDLGDSKSKGPGPARNFAWQHSIECGHAWHWVMDDNIRNFYRLNQNTKIACGDGTPFRVMEDFCLRYENLLMAGPQYEMFAPRKSVLPPFVTNTRIYSCNLIRNDQPFRWRGRYNEDTILSLDILKAGFCTVQFNAFLQDKMRTQVLGGGNTAEFYSKEGTAPKSDMLVKAHPDVARAVHRFGRDHHFVDYKPFQIMPLIRKPDLSVAAGVNDYGMTVRKIDGVKPMKRRV